MARLWQFLTDSRVLGALGLAALAAILFLGAESLEVALIWAGVALVVVLAGIGIYVLVRHHIRKRNAAAIGAVVSPAASDGSEVAVLRKSMIDAVNTIKTSKLGLMSGTDALYELPWYMVIGNPAAGKSSAIGRSGLQFPIAGSKAVQGVGGTRNCDWFFTTDAILLDTAGRYSVEASDRSEWFSFLDLLRKHRSKAPINGILIAVSVAELTAGDPSAAVELAKNLRTRVQELTERLGVYAPVYVLFTKIDLIAGFADFFHDTDGRERDRAWGATIRYNRRSSHQDVVAFFDQHFDELHDGLKEMSLATMAGNRSTAMRPGVFTFPLEFASMKSSLRAFLATMFEENTYQFRPVFRGFYFTSALQEGEVRDLSSRRVASRFDLDLREQNQGESTEQAGYFLLDLFRKVIFEDKDLVTRYTAPTAARFKYGSFAAAVLLLGAALGCWSWSYMGNRQLVANVQADLDKVVKLQERRMDLQSRLEALDILQDRLGQLEKYRADRPLALSFGLYQGKELERKLREEYFAGVTQVMLQPVAGALEALLTEMNANPAQLAQKTAAPAAAKGGQTYQDASAGSYDDGYNALKTYLMLGDKTRAEPSHLNDQMTRYWRGWLEANRGAMSREQMIRSAERLMSFYVAQVNDPAWPQLKLKLGLLDTARDNLRRVQHGTPARDRVYADIKARANTRYQAVTVARIVGEADQTLVLGSSAVPGAFTRDAWEKFVLGAIRDVSNKELQSTDWVLKTASKDDLTLEGSPEQIQKSLIDMYKTEYASQWLKFVQGVSMAELNGFDASVRAMNRLGDPQISPISKLLQTIDRETSWDNPAAARTRMDKVEKGVLAWFRESVLRRTPTEARQIADAVQADAPTVQQQMGPIGREFAGVARLVGKRDNNNSLLTGYLDSLARVRTRLNQLKNQGDPGPGAKQFMQQTLDGSGSELADALKYVDEQMLTGMTDTQKVALRSLLVRPLMQTFAVIVQPSEMELNKTWQAQVLEPFHKSLAEKYPFAPNSRVEASAAEIGQVFGPEGQIAKFVSTSMGTLVVRRGDVLSPRTWADMGVTLTPAAQAGFPGWVAGLGQNGIVSPSNAGPQTVFQMQAMPVPGVLEYTIEIDGQQLRYRNTPPVWANMVHPNPQGTAGARLVATTLDGRTIELFNEPGQFGLKKLIDAAKREKKADGVRELTWTNGSVSIVVDMRITSSANVTGQGDATKQSQGFKGMQLPQLIVGKPSVSPAPQLASTVAGGVQ